MDFQNVRIIRCDGTDQRVWQELQDGVKLQVNKHGMVVRSMTSDALLVDMPKTAIQCIHVMSPMLMRIQSNDAFLAFKFPNQACASKFRDQLQTKLGVAAENLNYFPILEESLPDLKDPSTRAYIAELLLNPKFEGFLEDMSTLIDSLGNTIGGSAAWRSDDDEGDTSNRH